MTSFLPLFSPWLSFHSDIAIRRLQQMVFVRIMDGNVMVDGVVGHASRVDAKRVTLVVVEACPAGKNSQWTVVNSRWLFSTNSLTAVVPHCRNVQTV